MTNSTVHTILKPFIVPAMFGVPNGLRITHMAKHHWQGHVLVLQLGGSPQPFATAG